MPQQTTLLADGRSAVNSFFGSVVDALESGVQRIGQEVLPNWVGNELSRQERDLLQSEVFNQDAAPPRVDSSIQTGQPTNGNGFLDQVLWDDEKVGIKITGGGLVLMGVVLIGGYFVLTKYLRV